MSPFIGFSQSEALPKLGSDTSSVWNFCAQFSDVISRGTSDGVAKCHMLSQATITDVPKKHVW